MFKCFKLKLGKTEIYGLIKGAVKSHWASKWKEHAHGFRWELCNELPTKIIQYSDDRQLDRIYTRLKLGRIEDTDHYLFKCTMHTNNRETMLRTINDKIPELTETRAVRGSDYSPAIVLSEEKDKFVTESWSERKMNQ